MTKNQQLGQDTGHAVWRTLDPETRAELLTVRPDARAHAETAADRHLADLIGLRRRNKTLRENARIGFLVAWSQAYLDQPEVVVGLKLARLRSLIMAWKIESEKTVPAFCERLAAHTSEALRYSGWIILQVAARRQVIDEVHPLLFTPQERTDAALLTLIQDRAQYRVVHDMRLALASLRSDRRGAPADRHYRVGRSLGRARREWAAVKYAILCRVSGGVTGMREALLRKGDQPVLFDTETEAQAEALRLIRLRNHQYAVADFHYHAIPFPQ